MPRWTLTTEERFWQKVEKTEGCWEWRASASPEGYGKFFTGPGHVRAHRFAYELLVGPVPVALVLDHLCRNPSCVNPAHLEPVTSRENIRRGEPATKTACKWGHDWTVPGNVYYRRNGRRYCGECARNWAKARFRAAVAA